MPMQISKSWNQINTIVNHLSHMNQGTFLLGFSIFPLISALIPSQSTKNWFEENPRSSPKWPRTQERAKEDVTWHKKIAKARKSQWKLRDEWIGSLYFIYAGFFVYSNFFVYRECSSPLAIQTSRTKASCNALTCNPNELSQVYHKAFARARSFKGLWGVEWYSYTKTWSYIS